MSFLSVNELKNFTSAGGSSQVGRGVEVTKVMPLFTPGSFKTSSNDLDLGIDSDGRFMVKERGANYYTRAGQFSLDKNGSIVNPNGLILQGYLADAAGNITGTTDDLQIARPGKARPMPRPRWAWRSISTHRRQRFRGTAPCGRVGFPKLLQDR